MEEMDIIMENLLGFLKEKKFGALRTYLNTLNSADIAEAIVELHDDEEISSDELLLLYRILPKELAADTFVEMESNMQEALISAFSDAELRETLADIFLDDTVDIIEEMPANVVKRILENVSADKRKNINQILQYPEDSAGSIMTMEYVHIRPDTTVAEAFAHIRETGIDKETIYVCYVVERSKLVGTVSVRELFLAKDNDKIADIMETNIITANTLEDREDVAQKFHKYDFFALPVVDAENRMVGIVTVDDAIEVIQEETTKDMEKMAAIIPSEKSYFRSGVVETWHHRVPWLLFMMVSATFTSIILRRYESVLAAETLLMAYVPMLMGTGGNSANQACVTVVRGLSLGDIELEDVLDVIWKEIRVAVLCGLTLASVNYVKLIIFDKIPTQIALVICLTLVVTVAVAKLAGSVLPMAAVKLNADPAVMASPLISTIIDVMSLIIYMKFAIALLPSI